MSDTSIAGRASDWLNLAAAPTFALLALLSNASGQSEMLCSQTHLLPVTGMTPMYLLMAVFHSPVWLKLLSR